MQTTKGGAQEEEAAEGRPRFRHTDAGASVRGRVPTHLRDSEGSEAQSRKRCRSGALPSPCENHTTPRFVSQAFCMLQRFSGLTLQTSDLEPASLCGGSPCSQSAQSGQSSASRTPAGSACGKEEHHSGSASEGVGSISSGEMSRSGSSDSLSSKQSWVW